MNIRKLNLNLLKSLNALLKEAHVSRAAQVLFITQPAMSNALNHLRDIFKDKLLVPGVNKMVLTPKALKLKPKVQKVIAEVELLLQEDDIFDPRSLVHNFKIGASDYVQLVVLPTIIQKINEIAPNVSIDIVNLHEINAAAPFEEGDIDLAIGMISEPFAALQSKLLFLEKPVCVGKFDHPLLKNNFTQKKYLQAKHIANYQRKTQMSLTDQALKKNKETRNTLITVQGILPALYYAAASDLIATVPERLAKLYQVSLKLSLQKPPFPIADAPVYIAWHVKDEDDICLKWLRELIIESYS